MPVGVGDQPYYPKNLPAPCSKERHTGPIFVQLCSCQVFYISAGVVGVDDEQSSNDEQRDNMSSVSFITTACLLPITTFIFVELSCVGISRAYPLLSKTSAALFIDIRGSGQSTRSTNFLAELRAPLRRTSLTSSFISSTSETAASSSWSLREERRRAN